MKIRWNKSSVRFRITPTELAALEAGQAVEESLVLGSTPALRTVAWSTRIVPNAAASRLVFEAGVLQLQLSTPDLIELADPENEGVYLRENELRFFIEKDFPCAHPRAGEAAEPESETFVPPAKFEERKA